MMSSGWLRGLFRRTPQLGLDAIRARAEGGDAQAQVDMAETCERDTTAASDPLGAAGWYRRAAEQNDPRAQFELGMLCYHGRGVPCDRSEGLHWLSKAAQQGHAAAQYQLGMRRRSPTAERSLEPAEARIESYKWLRLAARHGSTDAGSAWEQMALAMSAEEVAEGNRRVGQFLAAPNASPG